MRDSVGGRERLAASGSLILGVLAVFVAAEIAAHEFPRGLIVVGLLTLAGVLAGLGMISRGWIRIGAWFLGALVLGFTFGVFVESGWNLIQGALVAVLAAGSFALARRAYSVRVPLPAVVAPERPVLFFNPKSGGGTAEEFDLAAEAEARGYRAVELAKGADLAQLVQVEVDAGADALAMAGGDGSQAVVAEIASERRLPYACIPAGTRNHFALDLGVDREDVVGALDAFVDGGERLVDLAEVNGRVFVNNVSLGIYAEAVQKDEYREAKIKTLLDTIPDVLGPDGEAPELDWRSPSGKKHHSGAAILVSNNKYRLGKAVGSGTRPKIDDGKLGIAVLADPVAAGHRLRKLQTPWRDWSAPTFEVGASEQVAAGIDGEAAMLEPPLKFKIRPGVLRVRIARQHPGASPSAAVPDGFMNVVRGLIRIALGKSPADAPVVTPSSGNTH